MKYAIGCFLISLINVPAMFFLDQHLFMRLFAGAAFLTCVGIGIKILFMERKHKREMQAMWDKVVLLN